MNSRLSAAMCFFVALSFHNACCAQDPESSDLQDTVRQAIRSNRERLAAYAMDLEIVTTPNPNQAAPNAEQVTFSTPDGAKIVFSTSNVKKSQRAEILRGDDFLNIAPTQMTDR